MHLIIRTIAMTAGAAILAAMAASSSAHPEYSKTSFVGDWGCVCAFTMNTSPQDCNILFIQGSGVTEGFGLKGRLLAQTRAAACIDFRHNRSQAPGCHLGVVVYDHCSCQRWVGGKTGYDEKSTTFEAGPSCQ